MAPAANGPEPLDSWQMPGAAARDLSKAISALSFVLWGRFLEPQVASLIANLQVLRSNHLPVSERRGDEIKRP